MEKPTDSGPDPRYMAERLSTKEVVAERQLRFCHQRWEVCCLDFAPMC
jgi:hypothetical protein